MSAHVILQDEIFVDRTAREFLLLIQTLHVLNEMNKLYLYLSEFIASL